MQQVLDEYLNSLTVGEPTHFGSMALFPVFRSGQSVLRYTTLAEALTERLVEVTEQESATVPGLTVINHSDTMVFVLDSEEIVGGKQNRIVNASFLIGPRSKTALTVSCVEHGRWHGSSPAFAPGEAANFSLKRDKHFQVRESLRMSGAPMADQGAVWESVAASSAARGVRSETGALHRVYEESGKTLEQYERALAWPEGAVGLAVALGGGMAGADLFDQPRTARALWSKLVRSYAMDALGAQKAPAVEKARAERLLKRLVGGRAEVFPSLGLGRDVRSEGAGATGAALCYANSVVHLSIFRQQNSRPGPQARDAAWSARRRARTQM